MGSVLRARGTYYVESLGNPCGDQLEHLGWVIERSYEIGGVRFGVRTTSEAFGDWVEYTLAKYRLDAPVDPTYSFLVGDGSGALRQRTHIYYKNSYAVVRTRDLFTLGKTLLAEVESISFDERADATYGEFALVGADDRIALVPSVLVAYISLLGRRLERSGLILPAEMTVAIDNDSGMVVPVPPHLDVPDDALARLKQIAPGNGAGDRFSVTHPLEPDLVCTIGLGEERLRPVSRARALYCLAPYVRNLSALGAGALDGLALLVEGAECYEVRTATARETLEALSVALHS